MLYTQSLGKGIVPIQKQKVSDMQLTPFSIFSCVPHHLNALLLPAALQHLFILLNLLPNRKIEDRTIQHIPFINLENMEEKQ